MVTNRGVNERHYLGDGLYAERDQWGAIILSTERPEGRHYVVLEPDVLAAFEEWLVDDRSIACLRR